MTDLKALQKDVALLTTLFNSRESRQVCLEEVFRVRNRWQQRIKFPEFIELATQIHGKSFDQRITETRVRILIELTCPADVKQRGEYSKAVSNARKAGCKPSELSEFFKSKGGIRNAAYG
jgi:hypothetical protein